MYVIVTSLSPCVIVLAALNATAVTAIVTATLTPNIITVSGAYLFVFVVVVIATAKLRHSHWYVATLHVSSSSPHVAVVSVNETTSMHRVPFMVTRTHQWW